MLKEDTMVKLGFLSKRRQKIELTIETKKKNVKLGLHLGLGTGKQSVPLFFGSKLPVAGKECFAAEIVAAKSRLGSSFHFPVEHIGLHFVPPKVAEKGKIK